MTVQGFLDKPALRQLTGSARAKAQEAFLKAEGIPFKRRGTEILVLWTHAQAWIEGHERPRSQGINWAAV